MAKLTDKDELENWLENQPRGVSTSIAARAALRMVPAFFTLAAGERFPEGKFGERAETIILPSFRAMSIPWIASKFPAHKTEFSTARAAASAAEIARRAAVYPASLDPATSIAHGAACSANSYVTRPRINAARTADIAARIYPGANYKAAYQAAYDANKLPHFPTPGHNDQARKIATRAAISKSLIWQAIMRDAGDIDGGMPPDRLAANSLWTGDAPKEAASQWVALKVALLALDEDWEVWIDWYEDRLHGRPALEALEIARVTEITEEEWAAGPGVVNAHIRELVAKHTTIVEEPQSYGHSFLIRDAKFNIADEGGDEDLKIARQTTTRQQQQQLKERLQAFSQTARRTSDRNGWEELQPIVEKLIDTIDQDTEIVAREITILWDLLVDLASFLEMNEELQKLQRNTNATPLDPDERRALSALVTSFSAFVRQFPTGRKRDDDSGAFRARKSLLDPVRSLFIEASDRDLLNDQDRDLLIGLLQAAKRGDFQGGKAAAAGVGSARNLIVKGAAYLSAVWLGGVVSIAAPESIAMQSIAQLYIETEKEIIEIVKDMPAGYEQAIRELIRNLHENLPMDQPQIPQVGLPRRRTESKPES